MFKKIYALLLIMILSLFMISCNQNNDDDIEENDNFMLEISGPKSVEAGCQIVLNHNYYGDSKNIIWESSNDDIIDVIDGVVIGKKIGVATVSLTIENYIATYPVTVTESIIEITIKGVNTLFIGESYQFDFVLSKEVDFDVTWKSSNEDVITVSSSGIVTAVKEGIAEVMLSIENSSKISTFKVTVKQKTPTSIKVSGPNKIEVDDVITLDIQIEPENAVKDLIFISKNENIAVVSNDGVVTGISKGVTEIIIKSKYDETINTTFIIEVTKTIPQAIYLKGETEVTQGDHIVIGTVVTGEGITNEVKWSTSDETTLIVYHGIVQGIKPGKAYVYATSVVNDSIVGKLEIEVLKRTNEDIDEDDLERVNNILNKMTLSQKIGQMFVVGFSGTTFTTSLNNAIDEYHFGNVIYMGANVADPSTISKMSNDIQNKMISSNLVPGFISIDQEGGRVIRLKDGGTHFVSNMTVCASNNYQNAYLEGLAIGQELKNYGINTNFAPVLDVNNNPENPIIGIRSYADNPLLVSLFGKNMINGLKAGNVMACSKHFPGHGNTSVDSHFGLPEITSSIDELYQTELAPFISAVSSKIDAIMTTHIIFTAIDSEYPATLSYKVLTNLLREELAYDGLIITDGMEMKAVTSNFGGYGDTAVLAVKAGVDILLYTSTSNPKTAHTALINAVNNGEISIDRIDESVRRILLKKLKYNLFDDYLAYDKDISDLLKDNETLNNNIAQEALTLVKGYFKGLDKTKSTLIISPTTSYDLGSDLSNNSFANYACNYLKANGHQNVEHYTIANNISNTDANFLIEKAKNFDQIVVAASNVKTSNYYNTANFINNLTKLDKELIVIALDTPYDLMVYNNLVENYICIYGYQKATVIALTKYLNNEFSSVGVLPIDEEVLK